jgi:hypothetical protein
MLVPTYIEKAVFLLEVCGYDVVSTATQFFGDCDERVGILEAPDLADMLEANHIPRPRARAKLLAGRYITPFEIRKSLFVIWSFRRGISRRQKDRLLGRNGDESPLLR